MGLISNGTTIFDAGALDSGLAKGAMTFIKKLTASSSANLSFVNGASGVVLDNTYKEYVFFFNNIHPQTTGALNVFFRDGGTDFDALCTGTNLSAYHTEDDQYTSLYTEGDSDVAQSATVRVIRNLGNDNDGCCAVKMHLFNPSTTTFVKHYLMNTNYVYGSSYGSFNDRKGGYINTATAIDGVKFQMASGNIDAGDIYLYGIA